MEEKRNHNYTTVFICFLKSGLYFTRDDTNAVGLQFMDEMRKHNPDFKPKKVQQREFTKNFTVNAFPKEFEPLIMACIEERRKSHNLQPRPKKKPGFKKRPGGGQRRGYQQHDDRRMGGQHGGERRPGSDERKPRRRRIVRPVNPDNKNPDKPGDPDRSTD